MSSDKILLVFLLVAVLLFAFPEVVFSFNIKRTESMAAFRLDETVSSADLQTDTTEIQVNENDIKIEQNIIEEIHDNPFIESKNISVTVKNGVTTLRGTANNLTESAAATADAFQSGANEVRNHLKIRDPPIIRTHK